MNLFGHGGWFERAEGSLVVFTLFTQLAVGAFCVLLVNDYLKRRAEEALYRRFTRVGTALLAPITAVGILASLTHLGRPEYAYRALSRLSTSWLSREVWMFSLFFALVAVYSYLWYRQIRDAELRRGVGVVTALAGLIGVYITARLYMLPARPVWNHYSTIATFFSTAFLLGPLAVATVYDLYWAYLRRRANRDRQSGGNGHRGDSAWGVARAEEIVRQHHRYLAWTLIAAATSAAVSLGLHVAYLARPDPRLGGSWQLTRGMFSGLLWGNAALSIGLPLLAAVALLWLSRRRAPLPISNALVAGTFLAALAGESMGRALFYLTAHPLF